MRIESRKTAANEFRHLLIFAINPNPLIEKVFREFSKKPNLGALGTCVARGHDHVRPLVRCLPVREKVALNGAL
jgi:hypothetical protein